MVKRRTYNTRLIKQSYSYRYYEIADLFRIHPNAIARWVKEGLRQIDDQKPYMIYGGDLTAYLDSRQKRRKRPCRSGEIFCCKCQAPQPLWQRAVDITVRNEKTVYLSGLCAVCNTVLKQIGSVAKLPAYQKYFNVLTLELPHIIDSSHTSVKRELRKE